MLRKHMTTANLQHKQLINQVEFFLEWATRVLLYFIPSYDKSLEFIFISASYMTKKLKNDWSGRLMLIWFLFSIHLK